MSDTEFYTCTAEAAPKIWRWLQTRGGIAIWESVNLSNPGASWTTPAHDENGGPASKPTWQASNTPRIITDPAIRFARECFTGYACVNAV